MDIRQHKNAHIYAQIHKLKNKAHQISIIAPLIMDEETWVAYPVCEAPFNLANDEYRVDLYYQQLKWVIEVDEKQHMSPEMIAKDKLRDAALSKMGIKTTRVVITKEGFIHVDEIKKLKTTLISKTKELKTFQAWDPNIFDVNLALSDDPSLIFIFRKDDETAYPPFRLPKTFHNYQNLKVVILKESNSLFADPNLKMIDGVYDYTYLGILEGRNGFVSWSGMPITHSIVKSGDTITNMTGGPKHNLKKYKP